MDLRTEITFNQNGSFLPPEPGCNIGKRFIQNTISTFQLELSSKIPILGIILHVFMIAF